MKDLIAAILHMWGIVIGLILMIVIGGAPLWAVMGLGFWLIWR